MKGPSIEAIRRFKEQQERKKREDEERKIKDKLNTLEHRASQGDRKAKQDLKRLERVQDEQRKTIEFKNHHASQNHPSSNNQIPGPSSASKAQTAPRKKQVETDFEDLMKLAQQNKNEIRVKKPPEIEKKPEKKLDRRSEHTQCSVPDKPKAPAKPVQQVRSETKLVARPRPDTVERTGPRLPANQGPRCPSNQGRRFPPSQTSRFPPNQGPRFSSSRMPARTHAPIRNPYMHYDDEEEEEHDEELDDFVVSDDDEDMQDELKKTLKSVFKYDKRRCDLREQELDRQYRAIGHVSTFEDLEREERRASRLAAAEDARAQRDEEERKRLKRARLKGR